MEPGAEGAGGKLRVQRTTRWRPGNPHGGIAWNRIEALGNDAEHLDQMRFPFVVTDWKGDTLSVQETAFATTAGKQDLDVVEMIVSNREAEAVTLELRLDGKRSNLPAFVNGTQLATHDGRLPGCSGALKWCQRQSTEADGLALVNNVGFLPKDRLLSGSSFRISFQ